MSQSTRNIEITEATFGYMYGSITFAVRPSYGQYRVSFNSNDGMQIQKWEGQEYGKQKRVTDEELVNILGGSNSWSMGDFIAMWQGWASGCEAGKNRQREKHADRVTERRDADETRQR